MSAEIETLVTEIENASETSEALERKIAQVAGVVAAKDRLHFLSDLDEAVELPGRRGWNFALSSERTGERRHFGAWIYMPGSREEVLSHAQAWHPAEAVVLAFLKGMREIRRLERSPAFGRRL